MLSLVGYACLFKLKRLRYRTIVMSDFGLYYKWAEDAIRMAKKKRFSKDELLEGVRFDGFSHRKKMK